PHTLEQILSSAAAGQPVSGRRPADGRRAEAEANRFPLTGLVAERMTDAGFVEGLNSRSPGQRDLAWARGVLESVEQFLSAGNTSCQTLALAIRTEIAVAAAENEADNAPTTGSIDPLFRLQVKQDILWDGDLTSLTPLTDAQLRFVVFDYDISEFLGVQPGADFPATVAPSRSYIAVFGRSPHERRNPLLIDALTAEILRLCDGTRTVSDVRD